MIDTPAWRQFRRLLLGGVVEGLLACGVPVDFPTIRITFGEGSEFHVPRLDNHMRFVGSVTARTTGAVPASALRQLEQVLQAAWLDLLASIELPVGDMLANTAARVTVTAADGLLDVRFDLAAD